MACTAGSKMIVLVSLEVFSNIAVYNRCFSQDVFIIKTSNPNFKLLRIY